MKNLLLFFVLLFVNPLVSSSQHRLSIEINQLRNSKGQVLLELNNENKEVLKGLSGEIVDNKCVLIVENLKPGKYAFKYFHDENKNEEIDTNWMGIPKEGYGFSNNAKGKFGPPPFKRMIFELKQDTLVKSSPTYLKK